MAFTNRWRLILITVPMILVVIPMFAERPYAESASLYELKINKTYQSYDITGDYKPDKLSITAKVESGWIGGFAININGETVLTKYDPYDVPKHYGSIDPASTYYPTIKYIKLADGQPLLYIHLTSYNGYYRGGWVYKYESDGVLELLQTEDLIYRLADDYPPDFDYARPFEYLDSAAGNSLIFNVGWYESPVKQLSYRCKYQNGKFIISLLDDGIPKLEHMDLEFNSDADISFDWGTDLLKKDASAQNSFNLNLAKAAIYLSEGTYHGQDEMENRMKTLGFTNPKSEYYKIDAQTNTSPITVASDVAEIDGTEYLLIGVAVRGTQDDGWDFITDIRSGALNVDGFAEAGETGMAVVKEYYDKVSSETGIDKNHTIIFVTGHSLGAAIAGQIAGNLQDDIALQRHIFAYTFASPYYETHGKDIGSFTNIHNIVNTEDAVPKFPLGGVRYGIDHTFTGDGSDMLDQHMLGTYLRALKLASPPKTVITSASGIKKAFTVKWKNKSKINGYQLQYGTKSTFKGAETVNIKMGTTTRTIKHLKSKKKYYVRVRTYKKVFGHTYYSKWSSAKTAKTK